MRRKFSNNEGERQTGKKSFKELLACYLNVNLNIAPMKKKPQLSNSTSKTKEIIFIPFDL